MAKLIFRQKAIDDLTMIWDYTVTAWSEAQADKYYKMIELSCNEIAHNPEIGRKYNQINNDILGYMVGKHIIFYRIVSDDEVEIIRILHTRMDLKNRIIE
jgi:toxin ParE1/3/4